MAVWTAGLEEEGFPLNLESQGFQSTNNQSKPPTKGYHGYLKMGGGGVDLDPVLPNNNKVGLFSGSAPTHTKWRNKKHTLKKTHLQLTMHKQLDCSWGDPMLP